MNTKRLIALLLVLLLTFAFFACDTPTVPPAGGETPGGETPGGETPGGETPGGETPGGETPGGETPGGETPGGGSSTTVPATELTYELSADGSYYTVTGGNNITSTIIIPETHEGKPVREIAAGAFRYTAQYVRKIVLPDNLKKVGAEAFDGCNIVIHLTIGRGLEEVGGMLLQVPPRETYNRSSLSREQVCTFLPLYDENEQNYYSDTEGTASIEEINGCLIRVRGDERMLMAYIGNQSSLTLPNGITDIANEAFYENRTLATLTMPDTIKTVGSQAFAFCTYLSDLHLSASLTEIGSNAFSCCMRLSSVTLPNGLKKIGGSAFASCMSLTAIVIPDSVERIEQNAFDGTRVATVTLGNSLTYIGTEAFVGCPITEIVLPASVNYISWKAFKDCNNLTRVVFEDPNGWQLNNDPADSAALSDPETAATYLTNTYVEKAFRKPN